MTEEQKSYRQIFKATSLFGGVQGFKVIISIIRSKVIAVLLGPTGMGIMSLLTATTSLISVATNFGLGVSALKDISAANGTGSAIRIATVVKVFRRLVWITGTLGAILTLCLSPWLSEFTFGNRDYTLAFIWISVTLLISQLSDGQLVILQGLRKMHSLAKANLAGSTLGLVLTLPLYYFLGIDGIVPGIIITSLITIFFSWIYSRQIKIINIKISRPRTIAEGKVMLKMGVMVSISGLTAIAASYILKAYISNYAGVEQVGLYSAGFSIIGTYVGLVFNAMATDYYPRLSAIAYDNNQTRQLVNQQVQVAILVLAPLLSIFLVYINWIVILLYSGKFVAINEMIHWAAIGIFFKTISWAIGFLLFAKGASKIYFFNELTANIIILISNIVGFKFWGLTGLGISYMISYLLAMLLSLFIAKYKWAFYFEKRFYTVFIIQICLAIGCLVIVKFLETPYVYIVGSLLIIISSWYSFREMDKRLGLIQIYTDFRKRKWKR